MTIRQKYEKLGYSPCVYKRIDRTTGALISSSTSSDIHSYELNQPTLGSDPAAKYATATNYSVNLNGYSRPSGFCYGETATENRSWSGNLTPFGFPVPPGFGSPAGTAELSSLYSAAVLACLEQAKNQKVNIAVMYAERLEAAKLVVSLYKEVARGLSRTRGSIVRNLLKRRPVLPNGYVHSDRQRSKMSNSKKRRTARRAYYDGRTMAQLLEEAGDFGTRKWLEFGFGVRPIYNDIVGVIDALAMSGETGTFVIRKTRTNNRQLQPSQSLYTFSGGLRFKWLGGGWEKQSVRAILRLSLQSPALATASSLGMTNPAALAWELIPMSWLVDAFVPVGGWIGSMDALIGYSVHPNSCVSYKTSREATWNTRFDSGINGWSKGFMNLVCSEYWRSFQRAAPWPSSVPFPRYRPPSFSSVANAFANVQSIITQDLLGSARVGRI